jgi:hypothetical protein
MREIDLHIHTSASDGTCPPAEAVRLAKEAGLRALAVTDHDTVEAHEEARREAERVGIEFVPGIEISTKYGVAVHILGYYIDAEKPGMRSLLNWIVEDRDRRNEKMCALMAADGLPVSYAAMKERFGEVIGRPNFGQVLVELGLARDVNDAFARYVEKGQRYYIARTILPIERAVESIVEAGGVAVLAHPYQYNKKDPELRELIEHCMDHGLRGMECRYSGYGPERVACLEALAGEYGLLKTGGSDFHGQNKPCIRLGSGVDGELAVPYEWLERLREAAEG